MMSKDGCIYIGKWLYDKQNGYGSMIWPQGHRYEGQWRGGMRHGQGKMIKLGGEVREGFWDGDRLVTKKLEIAKMKALDAAAASKVSLE
eukprot:CAMPEP_0185589580 /NCGR_PEP_ID=MMETSP0434-20130131/57567_1 /TAXON_ID=626734 ORGANISM="Favella taraikaensis, Strain Fe Narragansett Bay" /NCGR_SAMPLE_ID=MMETSP0434 /ASSEMBLY_ACC=CAM_ASM_000379 /LENGTH=88 /DNA_ID=CAMNT_0028213075 /DNA_START=1300 /DNA_END=1563 /DNA_ORIENTATION=+